MLVLLLVVEIRYKEGVCVCVGVGVCVFVGFLASV